MLKKILAAVAMLATSLAFAAVDVNKATTADLDGVKGIGPVTSQLILKEREKSAFKDWPDFISRVKGIGDSRAAKLSNEGLTINGASYAAPAGASRTTSEKVKDGARAATEKTKDLAKEAKDKVTGK